MTTAGTRKQANAGGCVRVYRSAHGREVIGDVRQLASVTHRPKKCAFCDAPELSNHGQLRRNTDRTTVHRLAQLALAIA